MRSRWLLWPSLRAFSYAPASAGTLLPSESGGQLMSLESLVFFQFKQPRGVLGGRRLDYGEQAVQ